MKNLEIDGTIRFFFDVRIPTEDIAKWTPERLKALFDGMALIKAAADGNDFPEAHR